MVVHGPLTALMLAELVRQQDGGRLHTFEFRGRSPLFDLNAFRLVGRKSNGTVDLQAQGPDGKTAMTAVAEIAAQS